MKSYVFKVELIEEEDGGYSAVVPALPGCAASGDTVEEAIDCVREMAQAYIEVLVEDGRQVPLEDEGTIAVVDGAAVSVSMPA